MCILCVPGLISLGRPGKKANTSCKASQHLPLFLPLPDQGCMQVFFVAGGNWA